jgi:hypothetical protein
MGTNGHADGFTELLDSRPELLSDLPIARVAQDHLGFGAYAEALAELIDSPRVATPLTIAIDAPWGAGKTSLARLVEEKVCEWPHLRGDPQHLVCWFNAWLHSDAPNLGTALSAAVGKTVARGRLPWRRLVSPIPAGMLSPAERRRRHALVLLVAALAAVMLAFVLPALGVYSISRQASGLLGAGVLAGVPIAVSLWTSALGAAQATATFVNDPQSQASTGSMADVASQFAGLVRAATRNRRRLVIFIDDLDRCAPDRAMRICETASLLLSVPDVVTVLIGDISALRRFAVQRSSTRINEPETEGHQPEQRQAGEYGRNYVDKIVQLEFSLPPSDRSVLASMLAERARHAPGSTNGRAHIAPAGGRASGDEPAATETAGATTLLSRLTRTGRPLTRALKRLWRPMHILYEFVCAKPERWFAFVLVSGMLALIVSGVLAAADPKFEKGSGPAPTILGFLLISLALLWVLAGVETLRRWRRRRQRRRSTHEIDETIRGRATSPAQESVETITEEVSESVSAAPSKLIEQRARRAKVEQLVSEGEAELAPHLPTLPRGVKRVANRHYLLASVAVSREMLGGTPPVTPRQLGKWALIMECWPELAARIVDKPVLASEAERWAKTRSRSSADGPLAALVPPGSEGLEAMIDLLRDPTEIAGVIERLVHALPAAAA